MTGEERQYASNDRSNPSSHLSCTVEMLPIDMRAELAIIDEIQMVRDQTRGWAWTRALLGAATDEVGLFKFFDAQPNHKRSQKKIGVGH